MKAVILAAGMSSRLYPRTLSKPKCLLEIKEGLTIIDYQIETLRLIGISDIVVATGFKSEKIKEVLKDSVRYTDHNNYKTTNNLHTVHDLQRELNQDVILLFSDVVAHKDIIYECVNSKDDFNLIIDLDSKKEDTMRAIISDNSIIGLGNYIRPSNCSGNFIGISKISRNGLELLNPIISRLVKRKELCNDYYTKGIDNLARESTQICYSITNGLFWCEVDTEADYTWLKQNFPIE